MAETTSLDKVKVITLPLLSDSNITKALGMVLKMRCETEDFNLIPTTLLAFVNPISGKVVIEVLAKSGRC